MKTQCAICDTFDNAMEVYPLQLVEEALDEKVFSARRFYDKKIHFRWVRCEHCGLLRSDPIIEPENLAKLYRESSFTYDKEVINLKATYGRYLERASRRLKEKEAFLEIGCGNGFFLEEALEQGFKKVAGVEPSVDAVNKAPPRVRPYIKQAMFGEGLFLPESFDIICIFQTLDHLTEPAGVLKECYNLLRPGGAILAINHNAGALSARILGESSPIIDIEHTYLYDKKTMKKIFEKNNFMVQEVFNVWNRYSLSYLFSLLPLRPIILKRALDRLLQLTKLSKLTLTLPLGNLGLIAKKPE